RPVPVEKVSRAGLELQARLRARSGRRLYLESRQFVDPENAAVRQADGGSTACAGANAVANPQSLVGSTCGPFSLVDRRHFHFSFDCEQQTIDSRGRVCGRGLRADGKGESDG